MQIKGFSELVPEIIEWEDIAAMDDTWNDASGIKNWYNDGGFCIVDQVGFVIYEDEHSLLVSDGYIESMELYGNVTKIPKSVIRKRIKLFEQNDKSS